MRIRLRTRKRSFLGSIVRRIVGFIILAALILVAVVVIRSCT